MTVGTHSAMLLRAAHWHLGHKFCEKTGLRLVVSRDDRDAMGIIERMHDKLIGKLSLPGDWNR